MTDMPQPIHDLIDAYSAGPERLRASVAGLSNEDLNRVPPAGADASVGKWSIQQVVVHLLDSDLVASDRMKRVAAMPVPLLIATDESAFVASLHPEALPLDDVLALFALNRKVTATVLRTLESGAFDRTGVHNQSGKVTLRGLVESYINHVNGHLKFIAAKRALFGK